jgi:hypothetical protein
MRMMSWHENPGSILAISILGEALLGLFFSDLVRKQNCPPVAS